MMMIIIIIIKCQVSLVKEPLQKIYIEIRSALHAVVVMDINSSDSSCIYAAGDSG